MKSCPACGHHLTDELKTINFLFHGRAQCGSCKSHLKLHIPWYQYLLGVGLSATATYNLKTGAFGVSLLAGLLVVIWVIVVYRVPLVPVKISKR